MSRIEAIREGLMAGKEFGEEGKGKPMLRRYG